MTDEHEHKRYLKELEIGEKFDAFLVLRAKELLSKRDGEPYLKLEFGDRSGRLTGMIWEDAEQVYQQLFEGDVVKVRGMIEAYRDSKQVSIKMLRKAKSDDNFDPADFLPMTDVDPAILFAQLREITDDVKNKHLKQLLLEFFDDSNFAARWQVAPAGKLWHHNRIGGLVEHTLSLTRLCLVLADHYENVDKDLLIAGAILHDIGKVEEYAYETHIDYTDRGRLVGHITLGAQWTQNRIDKISNFPRELGDKLIHLILSHQDEFGSPVRPAFVEAFLLNYADLIDSKMDALKRISGDLQEGEQWKFVNLLQRHIRFEPDDPSDK
ncbi:3'-5' exoribonuclease YhaM family protein [Calditrichota bacterium]